LNSTRFCSAQSKIIVDFDEVAYTYENFRNLTKLKKFKNLETVHYKSVNNLHLAYLGDLIGDASDISPTFSLFHRKWDEDSINAFEMVEAIVFAKTKASLILFKWNNFQLFLRSDEMDIDLDESGICVKYNAKFNILDIQDFKIYSEEDCKEDDLLSRYFDWEGILISDGHFKNLTVSSLHTEVFHNPLLFPVENMVIDFTIAHLYVLGCQCKLLDFAERVTAKDTWKVKRVFISVHFSYLPSKSIWN
jgi:hypothetical protein